MSTRSKYSKLTIPFEHEITAHRKFETNIALAIMDDDVEGESPFVT